MSFGECYCGLTGVYKNTSNKSHYSQRHLTQTIHKTNLLLNNPHPRGQLVERSASWTILNVPIVTPRNNPTFHKIKRHDKLCARAEQTTMARRSSGSNPPKTFRIKAQSAIEDFWTLLKTVTHYWSLILNSVINFKELWWSWNMFT